SKVDQYGNDSQRKNYAEGSDPLADEKDEDKACHGGRMPSRDLGGTEKSRVSLENRPEVVDDLALADLAKHGPVESCMLEVHARQAKRRDEDVEQHPPPNADHPSAIAELIGIHDGRNGSKPDEQSDGRHRRAAVSDKGVQGLAQHQEQEDTE